VNIRFPGAGVPPVTWRQRPSVAEQCVRLLRGHRLGRLLDAGGGEGQLAAHVTDRAHADQVAGLEATVLDRDPAALAQVPRHLHTVCGRIEDIDCAGPAYRTILVRQVLHYLDAPDAALRLMSERLDAGGLIYIGQMVALDPGSAEWLGTRANWRSCARQRVWTSEALLDTVAAAGLSPRRMVLVPYWQELASSRARRQALVHWLHAVLRLAPHRSIPTTDNRGRLGALAERRTEGSG
jgi:SAM-dependent methyltransferase